MSVSSFNTPTKRDRLAPKAEPYWFKISKGRFIGYRKGKNAGSWVARAGKKIQTIGDDAHIDYEQALRSVIDWCEREDVGGNRKYLLEECITDYVKDLQRRKGAKTAEDTRKRMQNNLPESMMKSEVSKLTTAVLEDWLHDLDMHESSANRTFSILRAALNNAFRRGIVPSDQQWRRVQAFRKADRRRELFLTDEQVQRLLDATAEETALHALLKAGILTGARLGELVGARVKDLDIKSRSLKLDGKTGARDCYLSADSLAFFKQQAKSKLPEAFLLTDPSGGEWKHWSHSRLLKRAVKRAQLPPETVFYSLRHYHISKAVGAGISLLAIARNCGTSVQMIQDHYGKFTPDTMADMMDLVELGGVK